MLHDLVSEMFREFGGDVENLTQLRLQTFDGQFKPFRKIVTIYMRLIYLTILSLQIIQPNLI